MLRAGLDAAAWEEKLSWRYPETAWFHVYAAGMTLRVECTQGHPMPELDSGQPGDLVASRDGVVETIEVFAGTAAVRPGAVVRKGQVLIRGQERGRDETFNAVQARGSVTARCWRTVRVRVPLNQVKSWETGRETVVTQLCTPWFQFPAETEKPEYLAMNLYESVQPVAGVFSRLAQNAPLPGGGAGTCPGGRRGVPTGSPRGGGNTLERSPSGR
ncbi:MAG: sporulation protein YqfD [Lachnospiraceae bacterium]